MSTQRPNGGFGSGSRRHAPSVPSGHVCYAIGDVHGRKDLLESLHQKIADDAEAAGPRQRTIIYLGDLIDRGPDSFDTVELLLNQPLEGFSSVYLLGNHEATLLSFLRDTRVGPNWLDFGGGATLRSYGIAWAPTDLDPPGLRRLQRELVAKLPSTHLAFFRSMQLTHAAGDYLFVHAGIRPGVPLAEQETDDLIWIRDEFLHSDLYHGAMVVHGHSIVEQVEIRPNRIGIDTGAYYTDRLSCLALEGASRRILST